MWRVQCEEKGAFKGFVLHIQLYIAHKLHIKAYRYCSSVYDFSILTVEFKMLCLYQSVFILTNFGINDFKGIIFCTFSSYLNFVLFLRTLYFQMFVNKLIKICCFNLLLQHNKHGSRYSRWLTHLAVSLHSICPWGIFGWLYFWGPSAVTTGVYLCYGLGQWPYHIMFNSLHWLFLYFVTYCIESLRFGEALIKPHRARSDLILNVVDTNTPRLFLDTLAPGVLLLLLFCLDRYVTENYMTYFDIFYSNWTDKLTYRPLSL